MPRGGVMKKILFILLLVAAFAAPVQAATAVREDLVWYRLHLGMGKGDYAVAPQKMREFIDMEITSAFPDGFTITESRGQWQSPEHGLIRERTTVIDVQCSDTEENRHKVDAIADKYVKRFSAAHASLFVMRMGGLATTLHY